MPDFQGTRGNIFAQIHAERERQIIKFGESQYRVIGGDAIHAILSEEVGEVAKELNEFRLGNSSAYTHLRALVPEVIQAAAVCVAWLEALASPDYRA